MKESTQCAPNGYYFIPVYDKVCFKFSCSCVKSLDYIVLTIAPCFLLQRVGQILLTIK